MKRTVLCCLTIAFSFIFFGGMVRAQTSLAITAVSAPTQVGKYQKFEITFQIQNSVASNTFYPFDSSPPPGLPASTGISVKAVFTDPSGNSFDQPGFYYQAFDDQIKSGSEWYYPTNNYAWKVRFSPNQLGTWSYYLVAQDASGIVQTSPTNFVVISSNSHGFVKVSSRDPRYFEYTDGTYFPGLGFNMDLGNIEGDTPVQGIANNLQAMGANGIDLTRFWVTQFSIYGEAYGKWGSPNPIHGTQEPRLGIVNPLNFQFAANYPGYTPPNPPPGSEDYLWLEFNATPSADGTFQRFTPCRYATQIPLKQNTVYNIKVRYHADNLEGPKIAGLPYGFAMKWNPTVLGSPIDQCNDPSQGTVIAASYNSQSVSVDPTDPNWLILSGTFNSGTLDFIPYLYLTFNNVKSTDSDYFAGHVFVDKVWFEESGCTNNCANLISKPWMSMHEYINQKGAYTFDKILNIAEQNDVYLKAVMNEKNDRILGSIDFNGNPTSTVSTSNFYGNGTTVTKVRWLQQAWWRYIQARWGYSTNIHSWELLNEGDLITSHFVQADEFGKYMHCRVFGQQPINDPLLGIRCNFNHPDLHLVTTSFYINYPFAFWNNGGNAAGYKLYRDIDYADQHYYANVDDTSVLASFYDSALFSYKLSTAANFTTTTNTTRKPFIRGETAWNFPESAFPQDYFANNLDGGAWLHDFIWAGINYGGLMEQVFPETPQIYNIPKSGPSFDHRPMFGTYNRFIKDIPLNNGNYQDASASATNINLLAWGQKDLINKRAHLWIRNKNHTWKSVVENTSVAPQSGTVTVSGFAPNTNYPLEWWDTYTGQVTSTNSQVSNSQGEIILNVNNLITDTAVKIGNYSISPFSLFPNWFTSVNDQNADGQVNSFDFATLY